MNTNSIGSVHWVLENQTATRHQIDSGKHLFRIKGGSRTRQGGSSHSDAGLTPKTG